MFGKLSLYLAFLAFIVSANAYAGKVELTTYYPAPYGEYKELTTTENAAFASTSGNVSVGSTTNHAVLAIDNTLTLAPVAGVASAQSGGTAGSLRYSSDAGGSGVGGLLYKNSSDWQRLGGAVSDVVTASQGSPVTCDQPGGSSAIACDIISVSLAPGKWIVTSSHSQYGIDHGGACAQSKWAIKANGGFLVGPTLVVSCGVAEFRPGATTIYTNATNSNQTVSLVAVVDPGTGGVASNATLIASKI